MALKSSPARCGVLPLPEPAKPISPGRAFAAAISSATERTASDGCATRMFGPSAIRLTGSKSFTGSYGTFLYRLGLVTRPAPVKSSV